MEWCDDAVSVWDHVPGLSHKLKDTAHLVELGFRNDMLEV